MRQAYRLTFIMLSLVGGIVLLLNGYWIGIFVMLVPFGRVLFSLLQKSPLLACVAIFIFMQGLVFYFMLHSEIISIAPSSLEASKSMITTVISTPQKATEDVLALSRSLSKSFQDQIFTPILLNSTANEVHEDRSEIKESKLSNLVVEVFGKLPPVDFPDLKYRPPEEVRETLKRIFVEAPSKGFDARFKNPCWMKSGDMIDAKQPNLRKRHDDRRTDTILEASDYACLPYVYILGQPKCGTTDLFSRITRHPKVVGPKRKEIRFFTRGEFNTAALSEREKLGPTTSLQDFTSHFENPSLHIVSDPSEMITIDGGPHTLWWPTQSPDGLFQPHDIPPPQILRELQPQAKFIITLADPVHRMYSDYYFLDDDLRPAKRSDMNHNGDIKSPEVFHSRVKSQVNEFQNCVSKTRKHYIQDESRSSNNEHDAWWFRASQMCAHDRKHFAVGGWGRISIGLYVLFIEKWLEHFDMNQFLVLRLEDYKSDPEAYMTRVFQFLELPQPDEQAWSHIMDSKVLNEHKAPRRNMLEETDTLLREFYRPYNDLLNLLMKNHTDFLWRQDILTTNDSAEKATEQLDKANQPNQPDEHNNERREQHEHHPGNPHGPWRTLDNDTPNDNHIDINLPKEKQHSSMHILRPSTLDLQGLPAPTKTEFNRFVKKVFTERGWETNYFGKLCCAAFGVDLAAIKYLLYDVGIPANITDSAGSKRNALHCVAHTYILAEAGSHSHTFNILKGKSSWIDDILPHELSIKHATVLSRDVLDNLEDQTGKVVQWLIRGGANVNQVDVDGNSPLHISAIAGYVNMTKAILDADADPNILNTMKRNPLHYAAAYGHGEVAYLLKNAGADVDAVDKFNTSPKDIISSPGSFPSSESLKYFDIVQRAPRKIDRLLHPETLNDSSHSGWVSHVGGWNTTRLAGFEQDMSCDVDQYFEDEISGKDILEKYLARMQPILIRGLIHKWENAKERYSLNDLREKHGDDIVTVSSVPYQGKFGGDGQMEMPLRQYIDDVISHRMVGGTHPWYVFRAHPMKSPDANRPDSLANYDVCPTPDPLLIAFHGLSQGRNYDPADTKYPMNRENAVTRKEFVNAQWAFGGEGTGAPVHYHNTAWNALVYGAKKWLLYPPHNALMSNMQIKEFFETDMIKYEERGVKPLSCVQTAGDILIVPESWGHGVLNIQESVAIATEVKSAIWRGTPGFQFTSLLPEDNRRPDITSKGDDKSSRDNMRKFSRVK